MSWDIWDHFQVRSSGFPAAWLSELVLPEGLSFEQRCATERQRLRDIYTNPRLQEAIVWQNPQLSTNFLFPWLDQVELSPANSHARRVERKLLSYLQRYCAKNEAIGYFGPIGWGWLRDELHQPKDDAGAWLRQRTVYLEPWLFQRLAERWIRENGLEDHLPLRLSPRFRIEGERLLGDKRTRRSDGQVVLSESDAAILMNSEHPLKLPQGPERTRYLERRWVSDHPGVPCLPDLEDWARPLAATSQAATTELNSLLERKTALESARGRPRVLLRQSHLFLQDVTNVTGSGATRFPGQTYAGRLPYYEDCQRRGLDLPAAYLRQIREPLELVLDSARWFVHQATQKLRQKLDPICSQLIATRGQGCSATALWDRASDLLGSPQSLDLKGLATEVTSRWSTLLAPDTEANSADYDCAKLAKKIRAVFASPKPVLPKGRFHSVDLFFTARTGAVLGEIHPALFPFHDISTNFQHPNRVVLAQWYQKRAPIGLWPAWHLAFSRLAQDGWAAPDDYHLLVEPHWGSWRKPDQQLRLGDFSLHRRDHGFLVRHRDGFELSALAFVGDTLLSQINSLFKPFNFGSRRPRLRLGHLTVARQRWSWTWSDLGLTRDRETTYRRLQERAEREGLPKELFASFPQEVKPVLWQRGSALSCELFVNLLAKSGSCTLEEMWPERQDGWLANPDGTGTAEFRFVAFDGDVLPKDDDR